MNYDPYSEEILRLGIKYMHKDILLSIASYTKEYLDVEFIKSYFLFTGTSSDDPEYIIHAHHNQADNLQLNVMDSHSPFDIKDIQVQPYPVPHDAREPIQCTFSDGNHKLGVLTDVGRTTPHIEAMLNSCHALVLECNHDVSMLQSGPYSWALKQRVGGDLGHLENSESAKLLSRLDNSKLQHIVAAHLSVKNNTPALAKLALAKVLACEESWIGIADQAVGFDWRMIS